MSVKLADIFLAVRADDSELDRDLQGVERKTKGWAGGAAGKVAKFAGGIAIAGAAAAGAAIVKVASDGIAAFTSFEGKMNEVFTLLPGITQQAMGEMNEDVKKFSKQFGVLPEEVVPALYQALSAGVPPDNVFDFLAVANKAAVGGVAELETAVDGISSVVNAYGVDVLGAAEASDLMFTAVRLGKTNFDELSSSLFNVIPTAASLGVEFGDITAALAAMTAQGTPTSVATTQLRQLLVELSKDGGKASKAFEELSGKSFVDFIAEGGNVAQALQVMEQAAEQNNVRLSDMFGSVEAGNAALALTGKGAQTFSDNLAEMDAAAGATDRAFQQMDQGIGKSLEKMRVTWQVAMLDVGKALAPIINRLLPVFAQLLADAIPWIVSLFENIASVVDWFGKADESGKQLSSLFERLPAPIQAVIGVLQQIASAFSGQLDTALNETTGLFQYFRDFIAENMPRIQQIIETVLGAISTFWTQHGETIMGIVTNTFGTIFTVIDTVLRTILDVITLVLQLITGDWEGAWETLLGVVERIWDTILTVVGNQLNSLFSLFTVIDWAAAGRAIANGVWDGIKWAWEQGTDWFRRKLGDLRDLLPFSEPKDPTSPMRGLRKSGRAIVEQLQLGIEQANLTIGAPDLSKVALPAGAGAAQAGRSITVAQGAIVINGVSGANEIMPNLEAALIELFEGLA